MSRPSARRSATVERLAFGAARVLVTMGDAPSTAGELASRWSEGADLGHGIDASDVMWALAKLAKCGGSAWHYCRKHDVCDV